MPTSLDLRRFHDGSLVSYHVESDGNVEIVIETIANERAILLLAHVLNIAEVSETLRQLRPLENFQGRLAEVIGIGYDQRGPQGKKRVLIDLGYGMNKTIEVICNSFTLL